MLTLTVIAVALAVVPLLTDIGAVIVANAALWLVVASVAPVVMMLVVADAPSSAWSERIGRLNKYQGYGWAATFGYAVAFGVAGGFVLLGSGLVLSIRALSGGGRPLGSSERGESADARQS